MSIVGLPDGESVNARPWSGSRLPERILAVRLHALGDTVLTLPYLNALRRGLPEATLDFLTREEVGDIPRSVVLFDRVHEIGGGRDPRRMTMSALALVPALRGRRYDVVVDLQRSRISRIVRVLLNPPSWSEFDRLSPRLAGERTRATIEAIGLGRLTVRPDLTVRNEDAGLPQLNSAGWDGASDLLVLNPAGGFPGRRWPLAGYVRFAELWLDRVSPETQFVVLGTAALAPRSRHLKERLGDRLLDLVGCTAPDVAFALLRRTALVLSEDSGLMHMAWVAGAPTLALFGASRGAWARPHGSHSGWVRACARPDGTCIDGSCREGLPGCLSRLPAEAVIERAQELLREAESRANVIYSDGLAHAPPLDS